MRRFTLAPLLFLVACSQTDIYAMEASANKVPITIEGTQVTVLVYADSRYEAYGGYDGRDMSKTSILILKRRHIAAIEHVSGCKVLEADYLQPFQVLQTEIKC